MDEPVDRRFSTTYPIAEIFGPTIQGEGRLVGRTCYFIRFGGCDYRCSWCDSPHAVLPQFVRQLPRLNSKEILAELLRLPLGPRLVVLSGGNPGLYDLDLLVTLLHGASYEVAVETQGSRWRGWMGEVDLLTVSPKGPSAKLPSRQADKQLSNIQEILNHRWYRPIDIKVPIFTDEDYRFFKGIVKENRKIGDIRYFASVGTDVQGDTREAICMKFAELSTQVANDPDISRYASVLPQLHVLAWGQEKGH